MSPATRVRRMRRLRSEPSRSRSARLLTTTRRQQRRLLTGEEGA